MSARRIIAAALALSLLSSGPAAACANARMSGSASTGLWIYDWDDGLDGYPLAQLFPIQSDFTFFEACTGPALEIGDVIRVVGATLVVFVVVTDDSPVRVIEFARSMR